VKSSCALVLSFSLVVLAGSSAAPAHGEDAAAAAQTAKAEIPPARVFQSDHQLVVGGRNVTYTATAGTMLMKDDAGKPVALFGYTAYVEKGDDPAKRPILFAYNGGPGSASVWLHMGILGPQRVVVTDAGFTPPGPFQRVANEYSILDEADLVMIDPVGTGYSKPVGEAEGKDFWGVDQDITSVSAFIAQYVTVNGRWASPKYLLGESYGGMRSGGVAYRLLTTHNLALNGVILVSPYLDFVAGTAGLQVDLPYVLFFSAYAATAWYHDVVPDKPDDLIAFLAEAENFAETVYAPALFKGNSLAEAERAKVLAGMARFTGIDEEYWDRANLRVDEMHFSKELLRRRKETAGRIDSRFKGESINLLAERFTYDPFDAAVGPAFAAAFNDYYRSDLGVDLEQDYVLSDDLWKKWDETHDQPDGGAWGKVPFANTAIDLTYAMVQNPNMRVLVNQGYFDLATPFGVTAYVIDHMKLSPELQKNLAVQYYEAGHMMYVHPPSMAKFKQTLANFIE
jgi:carboxypeptidase C (cathepsin A)